MSGAAAFSRAVSRGPGLLWGSYVKKLSRNPVQTKMATSIVAAALGDAIAQRVSWSGSGDERHVYLLSCALGISMHDIAMVLASPTPKFCRYDWGRTLRLCGFNAGMGCVGHYYYGALDRRVVFAASTAPFTVATKVAFDQLVFSPICTLLFYAYKCLSEGRPSHYPAEVQEKFLPTLKAGWSLWPIAHAVNFAFVPTQHRILYANVVSVAGTFLLSRAAAGDFSPKSETKEEKAAALERRRHPSEVLLDVNVKMD